MGNVSNKCCSPDESDDELGSGAPRAGGAPILSGREVRAVSTVSPALAVGGRFFAEGVRHINKDYRKSTKVLGLGLNGSVVKRQEKATGTFFAVKSFPKGGLPEQDVIALRNEVEVYLSLDHPNVVRLWAVYDEGDALHMVMELMAGGELFDRVNDARFGDASAAATMSQMLEALNYLHYSCRCVHRDLKLENFLYVAKDSDHLKLIDFGFAKHWDKTMRHGKFTGLVGTPGYTAPEVLRNNYTEKCDIWSMGVIAFTLMTGRMPFDERSDEATTRAILKGKFPWHTAHFQRLPHPCRNFIQRLLQMDPDERPTAVQAMQDPWILSRERARTKGHASSVGRDTLKSLRHYSQASKFRRACLAMMAWSLSQEDRNELMRQFKEIDKDHSGCITVGELRQVLQDNFSIDACEAEALFGSMDMDCNKEIAYSEFMAAAMHGRMNLGEEQLLATFKRFDHEGKGTITVEDLRRVLGDSFEGGDVEELIREADADSNGEISYTEFSEFFWRTESTEAPSTACAMVDGVCKTSNLKMQLTDALLGSSTASLVSLSTDGSVAATTSTAESWPTPSSSSTPLSTPAGEAKQRLKKTLSFRPAVAAC